MGDGTWLYGQKVNFDGGTTDWFCKSNSFLAPADKTVQQMNAHASYRNDPLDGTVYFDDVEVSVAPPIWHPVTHPRIPTDSHFPSTSSSPSFIPSDYPSLAPSDSPSVAVAPSESPHKRSKSTKQVLFEDLKMTLYTSLKMTLYGVSELSVPDLKRFEDAMVNQVKEFFSGLHRDVN